MKKSLLTAILLLITTAYVKAQDYIPFIDNTTWAVAWANFGASGTIFYGPGTDETINGQTYRKVTGVPMTSGLVYIREDVAERKVYRLNNNNQEELLYDFSLEEDDQVTLSNGNTYTVTSRDSVAVMTGRKRVQIHLVHFVGSLAMGSETWIEGVGSREVPLKPSYELVSDPAYSLTCSNTGDNPVYNTGLANTGTPSVCPESTMNTEEFLANELKLWPNPLTSYTTISTSDDFTNATLTLYNSLGQQIKQVDNINGREYTLHREDLTSGIYLLQITQYGKEKTHKTLVVK